MTREQGGSIKIAVYNQDGTYSGMEPLHISYDNGHTWQPNPRLQKVKPFLYKETPP